MSDTKRKGVPVMAYLPEDTVKRMDEARARLQRPVTRTKYSTVPSRKLFLTAAVDDLADRVMAGWDLESEAFKEAGVRLRSPTSSLGASTSPTESRHRP